MKPSRRLFLPSLLLTAILFFPGCMHIFQNTMEAGPPVPVDYAGYTDGAPLEVVIQDGHSDIIHAVAYSPDGQFIATGSYDKTVKLWNMDGRLIRTFAGNSDKVTSVDFSPDGRFLICDSGTNVNVWSIDGRLLRVLEGGSDTLLYAAYSPGGRYIAGGSGDGTIRLWNIEGEMVRSFRKHDGQVFSLEFSPDGRYLASTGSDEEDYREIKVYTYSGRTVFRAGIEHLTYDFTFSPDGEYLIFGENNKRGLPDVNLMVHVRGITNGTERELKVDGEIQSIAVSPDSATIAAGTEEGFINLWAFDGTLKGTIAPPYSLGIFSIEFSPDSSHMAIGSGSHAAYTYTTDGGLQQELRGYTRPVKASLISPDGNYLVYSSGRHTEIRDLSSNTLTALRGHSKEVQFLSYSPGRELIVTSDGYEVRTWNTQGDMLATFRNSDWMYLDVEIAPNGEFIVCATQEGPFEIRDPEGGLIRTIDSKEMRGTRALKVSPDSRNILSADADGSVYLWDIGGSLLRSFSGHSDDVTTISYSPAGEEFASGSRDRTIRVWDISTGRSRSCTGSEDDITSVAFSSDGRYIAGGSQDDTVRVWSREGKLLSSWEDQKDDILSVAFLPDSHMLLSTGEDNAVVLRDILDPERGSIRMTTFQNGEWFTQHSSGQFDCSVSGYNYIHFVRGMQVYQSDQFWNGFYRPELLSAFIEGSPLDTIDITAASETIPEVLMRIERDSPENPRVHVVITSPDDPETTGDIFLMHNGRVVYDDSRGIQVTSSETRKEYVLTLIEGENVLQAGIYNKSNTLYGTSRMEIVRFAPAVVERPDLHILTVGVSRYLDASISLKSPSRDAEEIGMILSRLGDNLYDEVQLFTLTDRDASKEAITARLDSISLEAEDEDAVLLFFAGHGYVEDRTYYFLPYDTNIIDLNGSAVSVELLGTYIRELSAKKIALFLDTCQSGSAVKALGAVAMSRSIEEKRRIAQLAKAQGIAIFSASSADEYAYEIPQLGNGIFTYSLLTALEEKRQEISIDGKISLGKLLSSVNRITRDTAYEYLDIEQSPAMYLFGDDFYLGSY